MPIIATPIVDRDTDVKPFLNITNTTYDTELTAFIATASQMVVNKIGQVAGSPTVDEWHDGGTTEIVLRNQGPIQSVTSVTESFGSIVYTLTQVTLDSGSVAGAYTYSVDLDRSVLVRRASGIATPFAEGTRNIHVTYVAGYATTPPDIKHATCLLIKHLWETQRGGLTRPATLGETNPGGAFSWPRRVEEILDAYVVPGIG